MAILGSILMVVGTIAIIASSIWLLVIAFNESVLQGLLVLLIPIYGLVYVIIRWNACKRMAMYYFGGIGIAIVGMVLSGFSAWCAAVGPRRENLM